MYRKYIQSLLIQYVWYQKYISLFLIHCQNYHLFLIQCQNSEQLVSQSLFKSYQRNKENQVMIEVREASQ